MLLRWILQFCVIRRVPPCAPVESISAIRGAARRSRILQTRLACMFVACRAPRSCAVAVMYVKSHVIRVAALLVTMRHLRIGRVLAAKRLCLLPLRVVSRCRHVRILVVRLLAFVATWTLCRILVIQSRRLAHLALRLLMLRALVELKCDPMCAAIWLAPSVVVVLAYSLWSVDVTSAKHLVTSILLVRMTTTTTTVMIMSLLLVLVVAVKLVCVLSTVAIRVRQSVMKGLVRWALCATKRRHCVASVAARAKWCLVD